MPKILTPDERAAAKAMLLRYQADALMFSREVIHADPTEQQCEALKAISPPGAHVTIRSGQGVGKTAVLAWIVIWAVSLHHDVRVPCTAPGAPQLRDVLWPEIGRWIRRMPPLWANRLHLTQDRLNIVGRNDQAFAVARTARKETPEALQGFHADTLVFVIDEASGVDEPIFEVAEGSLTHPNNRVIMCANPTRMDGFFYNSHHKYRGEWTCLHWDCRKSPLVSQTLIAREIKRHGEDSNYFRIRRSGEFPTGGINVVLPLDLLERAKANRQPKFVGRRMAGLDVARFGDDDSAIVIRDGGCITHMARWHGNDTVETAGRVIAMHRTGLFDEIRVDAIGVGAGVADQLRAYGHFPVFDCNVSESATSDKYHRLRDQLWFKAREWLESGEAWLPAEDPLTEDLIAEACAVTYDYSPTGKYVVEPKDRMKERTGHSPDLTDAFVMTFADLAMPGASDWFTM